jgi:hypothetical protein
MTARLVLPTALALALTASAYSAAPALDYDVFKTRIEPIFLQKRAGHARCYVCRPIG